MYVAQSGKSYCSVLVPTAEPQCTLIVDMSAPPPPKKRKSFQNNAKSSKAARTNENPLIQEVVAWFLFCSSVACSVFCYMN